MTTSQIHQCVEFIAQADGLLITAGAGMGVDSGLPDFRGEGGLWKHYPALGRAKIGFTSIACPDAFTSNPRLAWGFYGHRLRLYRDTVPHEGFLALQRWAMGMEHGAFVFTSNVDGQFQKSGFDSKRVMEAHGSIHHLQCLNGCMFDIWPADEFDPLIDEDKCILSSDLPACPHCGEIARPNILMFGDWAWLDHRTEIQRAALIAWRKKVTRPVVIEIGAGIDIPTVRRFGEGFNAPLIRINPQADEVPTKNVISLRMGALAALRLIDQSIH